MTKDRNDMQLSCGRKGRTKHLISPTLKGKENKNKKEIPQLLDFETEVVYSQRSPGFPPFFPFTRAHGFCQLVDITGALYGDSFSAS